MSNGLSKAIKFTRTQLRHLRKYGNEEERAGAESLDQWLEDLDARQAPVESPAPKAAAGFARRDPLVTVATPEAHS